jgi:F-type H+-transporting ATPase subunit b
MKTKLEQLLLVSFTMLVPVLAFAQEHGEHGWDTTAIIASFVNFAVLIGVFVYLFSGSLKKFLKERRASVEVALTEAARMKAEAEAKHKEYAARMATLDKELASIKAEMVAAGQKERDRIIADAEQKAARMRNEAEFIIEQHVKQLRSELSREASIAAISAAEELLARTTTTYDQQRLAQEYLAAISAKGPADARKSVAPIAAENHA